MNIGANMSQENIKEKIIEILNKHSNFSLKDGNYVTVGLCIQEYLANKEIPRKENKGEIKYEQEKNQLADQILELIKEETEKRIKRRVSEAINDWRTQLQKRKNFNLGVSEVKIIKKFLAWLNKKLI